MTPAPLPFPALVAFAFKWAVAQIIAWTVIASVLGGVAVVVLILGMVAL